jgi:CubicO group peptidase (beta-lactamase class C family)
LRNLALTKTLVDEEPALHFLYNNYNPILLGLIIERVSGESVSSYLSRSIWSKIGTEANASWSLDSDEDAFEKMESGINARAVDFAKFGCLYRDGGVFDGKVVLSKKWIEESLSPGNGQTDTDYYREPFGRQILGGACKNGGF